MQRGLDGQDGGDTAVGTSWEQPAPSSPKDAMTSYAVPRPWDADLGATPGLARLRAAIAAVLSAVRSDGDPGTAAPPVGVSPNGRVPRPAGAGDPALQPGA